MLHLPRHKLPAYGSPYTYKPDGAPTGIFVKEIVGKKNIFFTEVKKSIDN